MMHASFRAAPALLALALLPLAVSAESFATARDVRVSAAVQQPRMVRVELDQAAREQPAHALRLITGRGVAVGFARSDESKNLMPEAIFDAVPIASGTAGADNTVENLRDGSISTVFQPVTDADFRFRFHFADTLSPEALELSMDMANVTNVRVRAGASFALLHDVFSGMPSDGRIALSSEAARAFEVSFTVSRGVPRVGEMKLLQPSSTLLFRAQPGQRYVLLYGGDQRLENPTDDSLESADALAATLGSPRRLTSAETGDHDGLTAADNCPAHWNAGQEDRDGDVVGDACDNCPDDPNSTQEDANNDGFGDACEDTDRDGIGNGSDNCPDARNTTQQDSDGDGVGNACDDTDDRLTSGASWFTWAGTTLVILLLAGIGYRVLKGSPN